MLEEKIREAIIAELKRQSENSPSRLSFEDNKETIQINGSVNVEDIVMVIVGSVAGGP